MLSLVHKLQFTDPTRKTITGAPHPFDIVTKVIPWQVHAMLGVAGHE